MTAKEKAEELVDKYIVVAPMYFSEAKQCALIAVDEIIKSNPAEFILVDNVTDPLKPRYEYISNKDFWQEVKHEIEKL